LLLAILVALRLVLFLFQFLLSLFEQILGHRVEFALISVLAVRHLWFTQLHLWHLLLGELTSRPITLLEGSLPLFFFNLVLEFHLLSILLLGLHPFLRFFLRGAHNSLFIFFENTGYFSEGNLEIKFLFFRLASRKDWMRGFALLWLGNARFDVEHSHRKALLLGLRFLDFSRILDLFSNYKAVGFNSSLELSCFLIPLHGSTDLIITDILKNWSAIRFE
jgi:hypothetical protein